MLYVFCVECNDKMPRNKRYNAYSVVTTHGKEPRVDFVFTRQPWAIKRTTLTALRSYNICNGGYIHLDIGITLIVLRGERIHYSGCIHWNNGAIPTALRRYNIYNGGYIH